MCQGWDAHQSLGAVIDGQISETVIGQWNLMSPIFGGGETDYYFADSKKEGAWGAPNWEGTQLTFKHGRVWPSLSLTPLLICSQTSNQSFFYHGRGPVINSGHSAV